MKQLLTFIFILVSTISYSQTNYLTDTLTTSWWYSEKQHKNHKDFGKLDREAPNGRIYTEMCDCNSNYADYDDYELVYKAKTFQGKIVEKLFDIGDLTTASTVYPREETYKDTITVTLLCKSTFTDDPVFFDALYERTFKKVTTSFKTIYTYQIAAKWLDDVKDCFRLEKIN